MSHYSPICEVHTDQFSILPHIVQLIGCNYAKTPYLIVLLKEGNDLKDISKIRYLRRIIFLWIAI
jgi:hypothetical protein